MLKTMTAQLPQNRPKVTKAATTGPGPDQGFPPGVAGRGCVDQDDAGGAGLGQEGGLVDQHPGHPAGADQAAAVAFEAGCRDGEGEAAALHLDQRGLGQDHLADGHRGQVVELDPGGHAGLGGRQVPVGGPQRRLLAQGDEPGRGQHRDVAGAEVLRRVLVGRP